MPRYISVQPAPFRMGQATYSTEQGDSSVDGSGRESGCEPRISRFCGDFNGIAEGPTFDEGEPCSGSGFVAVFVRVRLGFTVEPSLNRFIDRPFRCPSELPCYVIPPDARFPFERVLAGRSNPKRLLKLPAPDLEAGIPNATTFEGGHDEGSLRR